MKFQHIELFAGCGGMSLGLDAAGFDLFMANELSPMAGETFAFNLFGENLFQLSEEKKKKQSKRLMNISMNSMNLKYLKGMQVTPGQ